MQPWEMSVPSSRSSLTGAMPDLCVIIFRLTLHAAAMSTSAHYHVRGTSLVCDLWG
ncbi:MAG: hypothetical protein WCF90_10780 [Methanomicrobiales archaeon]